MDAFLAKAASPQRTALALEDYFRATETSTVGNTYFVERLRPLYEESMRRILAAAYSHVHLIIPSEAPQLVTAETARTKMRKYLLPLLEPRKVFETLYALHRMQVTLHGCVLCSRLVSVAPSAVPTDPAPALMYFSHTDGDVRSLQQHMATHIFDHASAYRLASVCGRCKLACQTCARALQPAFNLQEFHSIRDYGLCIVCGGQTLIHVQPPKPNRAELRSYTRKFVTLS